MRYSIVYYKPFGTEEVICRTDKYDVAIDVYECFVNNHIYHKRYIRFWSGDADITEEIQTKIKYHEHLI